MNKPTAKKLLRNFFLELLVYVLLVVAYFFLVLQFLVEPLTDLLANNLTL